MTILSNDKTLIISKKPDQAVVRIKALIESVPAYQRLTQNIDIQGIHSLDKLLSLLPVVTKSDLIKFEKSVYSVPASKIMLFSETSGTTGKPLSTPRGSDEFSWNMFNQANAYRHHVQPGLDRVAILHPSVMSPFVEVSARALQEIGVGYVRVFPIPKLCEYERLFRIFEDYDITTIMSTPTLIYKIFFEFKKRFGGKLPRALNKLLLTGEYITSHNLRNLDSILGRGPSAARAFVYGSSEAASVMYGTPDATYYGYLNDFVFEIMPIESAWVEQFDRPEGAVTGELYVTWLRDGIMPMLRYNTMDIFTVWKNAVEQEWNFRAEGRFHDELITPWFRSVVDTVIYSFGFPIYHFNVDVYDTCIKIVLIVDISTDSKLCSQKIIEDLQVLGMDVDLTINPKDHDFYDFSPIAKSSSFNRK
ncbi:hypothetical protein AB835_13610 [Candidatus Endobugula sertula]|uniref:AMP-dependent synthetase/ligase domain-containing protein n=1 Tax=Candidatus Endobugula sertula TaxID=62101 RepID=A0A1D2QLV7_9GAMM|nr:hypothetical protein AB835_13610 [Candidatus Endobugula sertula]